MRGRATALAGSALFLVVAPGSVAGLLPFLIGGWRFAGDFGPGPALRLAGAAAILAGLAALVSCFLRFAWQGLGTPAPVAPTRSLVVGGLYRHVRNPMYLAVVALIVGQALWFGSVALLAFAALVWLAFHLFVIAYEEPALRRRFPADYRDYAGHVGRWVPRLRPWRGALD